MEQCYLTSIMSPRAIQQLHLPHVVQAAHHPSNHLIRNPLVPRASSSVRTIKCKYMSSRLQIYPDTSLATRFLIQGTRCVPYINIFFREHCNLRIVNMIWCVRFPSRKTSSPINNLCLVVIQMERDLWHTKAEKADLEKTVKTLSPFTSTVTRNLSILMPILGDKTTGFEKTVTGLEQSLRCEALCAQGRILDAAGILIKITNALGQLAGANEFIVHWITSEFQRRKLERYFNFIARVYSSMCIGPGNNGRQGIGRREFDEAVSAYSTALSLSHSSLLMVLNKWARIILLRSSGIEAWGAAAEVRLPSWRLSQAGTNSVFGPVQASKIFHRERDLRHIGRGRSCGRSSRMLQEDKERTCAGQEFPR